jgi:hypothetical protein
MNFLPPCLPNLASLPASLQSAGFKASVTDYRSVYCPPLCSVAATAFNFLSTQVISQRNREFTMQLQHLVQVRWLPLPLRVGLTALLTLLQLGWQGCRRHHAAAAPGACGWLDCTVILLRIVAAGQQLQRLVYVCREQLGRK